MYLHLDTYFVDSLGSPDHAAVSSFHTLTSSLSLSLAFTLSLINTGYFLRRVGVMKYMYVVVVINILYLRKGVLEA